MAKTDKDRPRLGRGLRSFFTEQEPLVSAEVPAPPPPVRQATPAVSAASPTVEAGTSATAMTSLPFREVAVSLIKPNPNQPRRRFDEKSLDELAASIKATGLIQPVIVRPLSDGFELIAGERRWRAADRAGLKNIPALVRDVSRIQQAQMSLVENIHREDLNPVDRAKAYQALSKQLGLSQNELAGRLGEDRSVISNHLRLLELSLSTQGLIADGKLSLGHAKVLASIPDQAKQQELAELTISQGLSVRNLERIIESNQTKEEPPAPEKTVEPATAHLLDMEQSITRQLGMRVQLRTGHKRGKGRLILHYNTLDQFDDLMEKLGVKIEE